MRRMAYVFLAALLLIAVSAWADVRNVSLSEVNDSNVTGMATVIAANIKGAMPVTNLELNARIDSAPPANMVYEAWLVDNDSNYKRSMGVFTGTSFTSNQRLLSLSPYDSIAISLEPVNDSDPLPSTIVAMGNLPGTLVSASDFPSGVVLPANDMFQRQVIAQRFNLTNDQILALRMQGWSYSDIALVANIASRCNRPVSDISNMLLEGQSFDQIASSCNTTVAMLFEPVPVEAVAGFRAEVTPTPGVPTAPTCYQRYPNGRCVVSRRDWEDLYKRGYTWREVAIAANIAVRTGEQVDDILYMTRVQGLTLRQIAIDRGLRVDDVMDVSAWPFGETPSAAPVMTTPPATTDTGTTMPPRSPGY